MATAGFDDVTTLDDPQLRELFHRGDPQERVWSAWVLGLRLGKPFAGDLARAIDAARNPGVRSHFAVMLAGFGERRLLAHRAKHDPDLDVRAVACRNLVPIGTHPERVIGGASPACPPSLAGSLRPSVALFVVDRLRDELSPVFRAEVLRALAGRFPKDEAAVLERMIHDRDRTVREVAIERLVEVRPLAELFPGTLEDRMHIELDPVLCRRQVELCGRAGRGRAVPRGLIPEPFQSPYLPVVITPKTMPRA